MEADRPHHHPQPLGRDGYISDGFASLLHPDQAWLRQRRFRSAKYSPLANGYSMLTMEDETGIWCLLFDESGNPIPGVFRSPGEAADAAEEHYGHRSSSRP